MKRGRIRHLINRAVKRLNDLRSQRLRHIADSQPDDMIRLILVRRSVLRDLSRDRREQVASLQSQIIFICLNHKRPSFLFVSSAIRNCSVCKFHKDPFSFESSRTASLSASRTVP